MANLHGSVKIWAQFWMGLETLAAWSRKCFRLGDNRGGACAESRGADMQKGRAVAAPVQAGARVQRMARLRGVAMAWTRTAIGRRMVRAKGRGTFTSEAAAITDFSQRGCFFMSLPSMASVRGSLAAQCGAILAGPRDFQEAA